MAPAGQTVWRAARRSLVVVGSFALLAGFGVLVAAVLTYRRGESWPVPLVLTVIGVASLIYAWRFGFHPRLVVGDEIVVHNPIRTIRIPWSELTGVHPGENGLVIERDQTTVEAWCVQTSRRDQQRGRAGRADAISTELLERARVAAAVAEPLRLRPAGMEEADLLTEIERTTNEVALAHVFPKADHPYPTDAVRHRWTRLLSDEDVEVVLAVRGDEAVGVIAYGDDRVRHLAVRPAHSGTGVGSTLLDAACEDLFDDPGTREIRLWVLTANTRARSFYVGRGWVDGRGRRTSEYPPHPEEHEMVRPNPRAARRGR